MAVVDLTRIFLQLRNSSNRGNINFAEDDEADTHLLSNSLDSKNPSWMRISGELMAKNQDITSLLGNLKTTQETFLSKPMTFDQVESQNSNPGYDRCIELADKVMQNLQFSEKKIKSFGRWQKQNKHTISYRENAIMENINNHFIEILHDRTSEFTKQQNLFSERLNNKTGSKVLESQSTMVAIPSSQFTEDHFRDNNVDPIQAQIQFDKSVENREKAITNVSKDVYELNVLFKDVAQMVVEQGSVLDRIDYNIDQTADKVEQGHEELVKARSYQKKNKKICIIITEAAIVIFLLLLFIIRHS